MNYYRRSHWLYRITHVLILLALGIHIINFVSFHSSVLQSFTSNEKNSFNPLLRGLGFDSNTTYRKILMNEGLGDYKSNLVVIEVGSDDLQQAAFAAKEGFNVIIFNASPHDTKRLIDEKKKLSLEVKNRIIIRNLAVFERSKQKIKFSAMDGSASHISATDFMDKSEMSDNFPNLFINVKSIALDDFIKHFPQGKNIYLLRIDAHGHEIDIMRGLRDSLAKGKVRYILFEYWVNVLDRAERLPLGSCQSVRSLLGLLSKAGYELFDLNVQGNSAGEKMKPDGKESYLRPLNYHQNCKWIHLKSEEARGVLNYTRGYWTDVLAVNKRDFTRDELF